MFWKIHFLLSVCFCGPALVNYGDPDPVDDKDLSIHEIRGDAIHIVNFTMMNTFRTLPPPQAPPAFSVYRYVTTHSCPFSWCRGKSWWWGTCDGVEAWRKILNARAAKIFRILSVLKLLRLLRLLCSFFGSNLDGSNPIVFCCIDPSYAMECHAGKPKFKKKLRALNSQAFDFI
jgi:hypothetical protein